MPAYKRMVNRDTIYTVYCLHNTRNNNKYVGITTRGVEKRLKDHKDEMIRDRSAHKKIYRAMNEIGKDNFFMEILEVFSEKDKETAYLRERYWIDKLNSIEFGYNECIGGVGKPYYDEEDFSVIYKKFIENNSIYETARYFDCDPETVKKALITNGINEDEMTTIMKEMCENRVLNIKKKFGKKVMCFDMNGCFLKKFDSISDGIRFAKNMRGEIFDEKKVPTHIVASVCNGKQKSFLGFIWKWG